jgi:peptide/nickel transport system ATP-binding protein
MYAGRPVEVGSVEDIYYEPRMPYTLGLLGSLPRLDSSARERLTPIVGSPPSLVNMPPGCPFGPRCPLHVDECDAAEPPLVQVGPAHNAACIRTEIVERAHGDAAEVFDESSSDTLIAADAYPVEVATSPEAAGDAEGSRSSDDSPAGSQTEPAGTGGAHRAPEPGAGETGTVTTPRGERA